MEATGAYDDKANAEPARATMVAAVYIIASIRFDVEYCQGVLDTQRMRYPVASESKRKTKTPKRW